MQDAGADHILDFVDAGLPSSICPEAEYVEALQQLLARVGTWDVDVLVSEARASPLEPYNGAAALRLLTPQLRLTALSASDPYAVVGVMRAFMDCWMIARVALGAALGFALSALSRQYGTT